MTDTQNETNKDLELIPLDVLSKAAACFKIMAHPIRLRIVDILMQGEYAVHEIAEMCGVRQHQISEHLRLMQSFGFLSSKRQGRMVYYSIISGNLPGLLSCIRHNCG